MSAVLPLRYVFCMRNVQNAPILERVPPYRYSYNSDIVQIAMPPPHNNTMRVSFVDNMHVLHKNKKGFPFCNLSLVKAKQHEQIYSTFKMHTKHTSVSLFNFCNLPGISHGFELHMTIKF